MARRRKSIPLPTPPPRRGFLLWVREWITAFTIVYDAHERTVITVFWTVFALLILLWATGIIPPTKNVEIIIIDCKVTDCSPKLKDYVTELKELRRK